MSEIPSAIRNTVGHFHPALVHFPIALLLTGAALEARQTVRGASGRSEGARFLLLAGLCGAAVAAVSGLLLFHPEDFRGRTLDVARVHRVLGLAVVAAALATVVAGRRSRPSGMNRSRLWSYRLLYFLTAALAGLAGHYGGWVVFGWGRVWTF